LISEALCVINVKDWLATTTKSTKAEYSYVKIIEIFSEFTRPRCQNLNGIVEALRDVERAGIDEREDFSTHGATLLGFQQMKNKWSVLVAIYV